MKVRSIADVVVRRRGRVVLALLAASGVLLPLAQGIEERLDVSGRVEDSESAAVEKLLSSRFESPFARSALLVAEGVPSPDTARGRAALEEVVGSVRELEGVTRTYSHLDTHDSLFVGEGGAGTFVVVGLDPEVSPDVVVPRLRRRTGELEERLRVRFPDARLLWTGEAVLNLDFRRASADEVRASELRALPLTGLLLLVGFGTVVASALPVAAGWLAVALTLGAAALLTGWWPLSITLQTVASMLGLGLGIDYALLTVSRFREALAHGRTPVEAAAEACRHAGGTVLVSGTAVAIGFLGLLLVPLWELRSLGVGGLLVVAASVLVSTTLLPALLAWLGPRVDAGRLPLPWLRRVPERSGEHGTAWRRWGRRVVRRPALVLVVAGLPVVLLALQALRLRTELPRGNWLPADVESTVAVERLRAMGRSGLVQEIRLVVELPADVFALGREGWSALARLEEALASDPRVERVRSLRQIAGDRADDLAYVSFLPGFVKQCFVSGEGDAALLGLIPRESAPPEALADLVRGLRRADAAALAGLPGVRLRVGGLPAFNAEYEDAVASQFLRVVGLVVSGTFLALFLAFRSVLIALKAIALNLLSVAGAFGALVLVFQEGSGGWLLGLAGATGSVFPAVPVLVFAVVFGLSMDYEVFLVARVAEARRAGLDEDAAVVEGLARTGGVISSAAAIMVAVFAAFTIGDFLLVKMLGFALAVAVLLDATVIRLAVGPALLRLAGHWNWWPGDARGTRSAPRPGDPAIPTRTLGHEGTPSAG